MVIIAGTGHRPDKLGGYGDEVTFNLVMMLIDYLEQEKATQVVTGMALGFDTALCIASLELKLYTVAAIPFKGQQLKWPSKDQKRYQSLVDQCQHTVVVSTGGYHSRKMQLRNQWMVDRCDRIVALWDGESGGTANTIQYANKIGRSYDNLWLRWCDQSCKS